MCGIAGAIALRNQQLHVAHEEMTQALQAMHHRGPDHQQVQHYAKAILGHVRLSIIDTSAKAHQPMIDETGRYSIIFNGEIFNSNHLKNRLQQALFRTSSDTEVLLYHLIENGVDGIQDLNGFFSFCFLDQTTGHTIIARDRMGEKPLYYAEYNNTLYFASELKALLAFDLPRDLDLLATSHYLMHGYYPPDSTALQAVNKLERQHCIIIRNGELQNIEWTIVPTPRSTAAPAATFNHLFHEAVERRLISDVPICTFLSGGIDSSLVSTIASQYQKNIPAFTLRFEGAEYLNESDQAARFARHSNLDHHVVSIRTSSLTSRFWDMMQKMDEPFGDSSALALYSLTQSIGQPIKVALSGDGGDELLGGYRKHKAWYRAQSKSTTNAFLGLLPFYRIPKNWLGRENPITDKIRQIIRYSQLLHTPKNKQYAFLRTFATSDEITQLGSEILPWSEQTAVSTLNEFLLADQRWVLQGDMLTKTDRCGMWSSKEIRSPFMDPEVVGFCNSLSEDWKIEGNLQKRLIYESFKDELPKWLWEMPKRGFEIPLQSNFDDLVNGFQFDATPTSAYKNSLYKGLKNRHTPLHLRYNILVLLQWAQMNKIDI